MRPCLFPHPGSAGPLLPPRASLPWLLQQLLPQLLPQLGGQLHPGSHVLSPATAACKEASHNQASRGGVQGVLQIPQQPQCFVLAIAHRLGLRQSLNYVISSSHMAGSKPAGLRLDFIPTPQRSCSTIQNLVQVIKKSGLAVLAHEQMQNGHATIAKGSKTQHS